ncbi:SoxR reducing system RseC family protein [bacterium]|nr:SoxR reducing system RseC family protein [bacterium]
MKPNDHNEPRAESAQPQAAQSTCEGRVVAVAGDVVTVKVSSPAECESCHSKEACHLAALGGRQVEVNGSGYKVGDRVLVIANSPAVVRASIVLYLIPALLVLVGSFAGFFTAVAFFQADGNIGSVVGVAVGIMISIVFVHTYKVATHGGGFDLRLEKLED